MLEHQTVGFAPWTGPGYPHPPPKIWNWINPGEDRKAARGEGKSKPLPYRLPCHFFQQSSALPVTLPLLPLSFPLQPTHYTPPRRLWSSGPLPRPSIHRSRCGSQGLEAGWQCPGKPTTKWRSMSCEILSKTLVDVVQPCPLLIQFSNYRQVSGDTGWILAKTEQPC